MANIWYDENSHRVTLSELKGLDGQYINNANVTCRLVDMNGEDVGGVSWPLAMSEDGTLTGTYVADIPSSIDVDPNDVVRLIVIATEGSRTGQWECQVVVRTRGC